MVRYLLSFFLLIGVVLAQESEPIDPLNEKIKSFLDAKTYSENREFIDVVFDPKSDFYINDSNGSIDSVKVIQTLKENGLLNLFFQKPHELQLNFKTSGTPVFFIKVMGDTLRNIGYYRYMTVASNLDASEFTWNISLTSEYATDPLILENELHKSGCKIINIERQSADEWTYTIDMRNAYLNVKKLHSKELLSLKRSQYAHWLNASDIKTIHISSTRRNSWYPNVIYYDRSLHILKVLKQDKIHYKLDLELPPNTRYIKIADLYNMKNIRDALTLLPDNSN